MLGFRFSGHVSRAEYAGVLRPPLQERIDSDQKIRLLVLIDAEFDRFEAGALWEDLKFGVGEGLPHFSAWERMALVSDADWVHHAIAVFGWLTPGEVRVFGWSELDAAKAWLGA